VVQYDKSSNAVWGGDRSSPAPYLKE
jgi:hypothetical protein